MSYKSAKSAKSGKSGKSGKSMKSCKSKKSNLSMKKYSSKNKDMFTFTQKASKKNLKPHIGVKTPSLSGTSMRKANRSSTVTKKSLPKYRPNNSILKNSFGKNSNMGRKIVSNFKKVQLSPDSRLVQAASIERLANRSDFSRTSKKSHLSIS